MDFEESIIIVDGLSAGGTLEIVEGYKKAFEDKNITLKVIFEKDSWMYDAMNKGVIQASGSVIGLINSDDFYMMDTLAKVAEFCIKTDFDIRYGDLRIFSESKEFIKKSKRTKKFSTRYWNHPTTFVTKKVYEKQVYAWQSTFEQVEKLYMKILKVL